MSEDGTIKHWLAANTLKPGQWFDMTKYRNTIIEECAREAESYSKAGFRDPAGIAIAAAIRALKDKP